MSEETVTVRDAAVYLRCTTKYIFDLLYSGRFKGARKVDGRWAIPRTAVEQHRTRNQRRKRQFHAHVS